MNACIEIEELLPDSALSLLDATAERKLHDHLVTCDVCTAKLDAFKLTGEALAQALPSTPPPTLAVRLLDHVRDKGRFEDLLPQVSDLFDLSLGQTAELLHGLHDSEAWTDFPGVAGLSVIPVQGGPRIAGALSALARLRPGAIFPEHRHHGDERNLILQGGFRELEAREYWPGESLNKAPGSQHAYVALEGPDCIIAAVLFGDLDFVGAR